MGDTRPKEQQESISFGDHGTFIVGGSGHGVGGHNDPAPPGRDRWGRRGAIVVGLATVVGTVFTVAAFWVGQKDPPTKPNPAAAGDRRVVFADVVTLTAATGFDLDGGAAVKFETRETAVDLFLGDYDELTSSTRNSGLINDSYRGDEPGAYERCRTYRRTGRATLAKDRMLTDYQQQYCFTTSDGRPAWLRTAGASSDGGVIVKAVVWAS